MVEFNDINETAKQIKLIRKYLKFKILADTVSFRGYEEERNHVYDLMKRTVLQGESHSALITGPRGSGKTTLVNSVLNQLAKEVDLDKDAIIVKLNGLVHQDEKIALKSITAQMQLENAVGERVFGTFAESLAFLLSCLQSGVDRRCKSMVFILDQFQLFCHSGKTQTLLYNLFDITHSQQAPVCVIGVTSRLDVVELLEKRVKSRFSHRHIFLFPPEGGVSTVDKYRVLMDDLLSVPCPKVATPKKRKRGKKISVSEAMDTDPSVPPEVYSTALADPAQFPQLDPSFASSWNAHAHALVAEERVADALEKLAYYTVNEQIFRNVLFQLVSKLSPRKPFLEATELATIVDTAVCADHRVKLLQSLSILELSLVIAMKHAKDIFDGQPMNFEMVLHRYTKFANSHSSAQTVPRPVILKAFEHLQALEVIMPVHTADAMLSDTGASRVQKEHRLYVLAPSSGDIESAVKGFRALPTEISHWFHSLVE